MQKQNKILNQITTKHLDKILSDKAEYNIISGKHVYIDGVECKKLIANISRDIVYNEMNKSLAKERNILVYKPNIIWDMISSNSIKGVCFLKIPFSNNNENNNITYLQLNNITTIILADFEENEKIGNYESKVLFSCENTTFIILKNKIHIVNKMNTHNNLSNNLNFKRFLQSTEYKITCDINQIDIVSDYIEVEYTFLLDVPDMFNLDHIQKQLEHVFHIKFDVSFD